MKIEEEPREKNLLDFDIEAFNKNAELEKEKKKLLNRSLTLLIPNFSFLILAYYGDYSLIMSIVLAIIILGPITGIVSLIFGAIFALAPYKGFSYQQNFYRSALNTYYSLQVGVLIIAIILVFRHLS